MHMNDDTHDVREGGPPKFKDARFSIAGPGSVALLGWTF
jgi:hypothetical protein